MIASMGQAKTLKRRQKGAELVEMALVLPILLVLLLGIIAFGRAYDIYQTITRAAREGARQAVLTVCATCPAGPCGATATTIGYKDCIQSNYVNPSLTAANLNPQTCSGPNVGSCVQNYAEQYVCLSNDGAGNCLVCGVQISYQYQYTLMLPFTGLNLTTLNIPTAVQMRLENQPNPPCSLTPTPVPSTPPGP